MPDYPFTALTDALIFTGDAFVEGHALLIEEGKVKDIVPNKKALKAANRLSYPEKVIAPGLIDCQVNGGGNLLLNQSPTMETVLGIALAHRNFGTAHILPTCISDSFHIMKQSLDAVRQARKMEPTILGIHFEGPHIATSKRGIHKASAVRTLTEDEFELFRPEPGETMIVTVAPECVPPDQIERLTQQGVIVSIGHSNASPDETRSALSAGARGFTHLYNAMSGMTAREPGVAGVALDDCDSWCGLIADGAHVAPEMIRIAIRCKQKGKLFFVSDAMAPAASTQPQSFKLNGQEIYATEGKCVNREGVLAGSLMSLAQVVHYAIHELRVPAEEALRMASTYPAAFLKREKELGKLLPGYSAALIILDPSFLKAEKSCACLAGEECH